jgi:hypothetical protein
MNMTWYSSGTYGVKLRESSRVWFCGGRNKVPVSGGPCVVISFEAFVGDRESQQGRAYDEHSEHGSVFVYDAPYGRLHFSDLRHSE